jgi:hypothetical protein
MFLILKPFRDKLSNQIKVVFTTAMGTIVSGSSFLTVVILTVGLGGSFKALFLSVVLPAAVVNTIVGVCLFNIINTAVKRGAVKEI